MRLFQLGDLVKDWRRMNVSFTRARSKLVIFGSRKTLEREPLLAQFFELMQEEGWIIKLSPGAATVHAKVFEVCPTPAKRSAPIQEENNEEAISRIEEKKRPSGKENVVFQDDRTKAKESRPVKRLRVGKKAHVDGTSVLKGRPILQDLAANDI